MKTGRLTLKPFSIVSEVLYDKEHASARPACACSTPITNQTTDYTAKVVFLCASTLNSTWLLMRSATDVWPGGLGSSSGELGHNLMDHHFRVGAEGQLEGLRGQVLLRPSSDRLLHPALSQPVRRQARLPARLRLSGRRRPRRAGRARSPSWASAARSRTRWRSPDSGRSARRRSARCCRTTTTRSRSTRRRRTSGDCRCSRSTAPRARTSA